MTMKMRFGKTLSVPSTIEIKHELRLMEAAGRLAVSSSADERSLIIGDLAFKHGFSRDRAEILVDRYGIARAKPEGAPQTLRER